MDPQTLGEWIDEILVNRPARIEQKLDAASLLLNQLLQKENQEMVELDNLTASVTNSRTVQEGAIKTLKTLSDMIAANKTDPVALQTLADNLNSESTDLAAAIVANTPAAAA